MELALKNTMIKELDIKVIKSLTNIGRENYEFLKLRNFKQILLELRNVMILELRLIIIKLL